LSPPRTRHVAASAAYAVLALAATGVVLNAEQLLPQLHLADHEEVAAAPHTEVAPPVPSTSPAGGHANDSARPAPVVGAGDTALPGLLSPTGSICHAGAGHCISADVLTPHFVLPAAPGPTPSTPDVTTDAAPDTSVTEAGGPVSGEPGTETAEGAEASGEDPGTDPAAQPTDATATTAPATSPATAPDDDDPAADPTSQPGDTGTDPTSDPSTTGEDQPAADPSPSPTPESAPGGTTDATGDGTSDGTGSGTGNLAPTTTTDGSSGTATEPALTGDQAADTGDTGDITPAPAPTKSSTAPAEQ
jgi:hypothetical protein